MFEEHDPSLLLNRPSLDVGFTENGKRVVSNHVVLWLDALREGRDLAADYLWHASMLRNPEYTSEIAYGGKYLCSELAFISSSAKYGFIGLAWLGERVGSQGDRLAISYAELCRFSGATSLRSRIVTVQADKGIEKL